MSCPKILGTDPFGITTTDRQEWMTMAEQKPMIAFDDFIKLDLRVATVKAAEECPRTN